MKTGKKKIASDYMMDGAKLYKKKNKDYGDSYNQYGEVMSKLFPKGVVLKTVGDYNKFGVFSHILTKIIRYSNLFDKDAKFESKNDTVKDLGVYSFMLLELELKDQ